MCNNTLSHGVYYASIIATVGGGETLFSRAKMAIPEMNSSFELPDGKAEEGQQTENERDISQQAVWSVSSCKQGYGVQNLRDGNVGTYWQ